MDFGGDVTDRETCRRAGGARQILGSQSRGLWQLLGVFALVAAASACSGSDDDFVIDDFLSFEEMCTGVAGSLALDQAWGLFQPGSSSGGFETDELVTIVLESGDAAASELGLPSAALHLDLRPSLAAGGALNAGPVPIAGARTDCVACVTVTLAAGSSHGSLWGSGGAVELELVDARRGGRVRGTVRGLVLAEPPEVGATASAQSCSEPLPDIPFDVALE